MLDKHWRCSCSIGKCRLRRHELLAVARSLGGRVLLEVSTAAIHRQESATCVHSTLDVLKYREVRDVQKKRAAKNNEKHEPIVARKQL